MPAAPNWSMPSGSSTRTRRRAPRPLALLAVLALLAALPAGIGLAQTDDTDAEPTDVEVDAEVDEVAPPPPADVSALQEYVDARNAAFAGGAAAGIDFVISRLHPDLEYEAATCRRAWFPDGIPKSYGQEMELDADTVVAEPDFVMAGGPLDGEIVRGSVYSAEAMIRYRGTDHPAGAEPEVRQRIRIAVLDGQARALAACHPPRPAGTRAPASSAPEAAPPPAAPPAPEPTPTPTPTPTPAPADPRWASTRVVSCGIVPGIEMVGPALALVYELSLADLDNWTMDLSANQWDTDMRSGGATSFSFSGSTGTIGYEEFVDASLGSASVPFGPVKLRRIEGDPRVIDVPATTIDFTDCEGYPLPEPVIPDTPEVADVSLVECLRGVYLDGQPAAYVATLVTFTEPATGLVVRTEENEWDRPDDGFGEAETGDPNPPGAELFELVIPVPEDGIVQTPLIGELALYSPAIQGVLKVAIDPIEVDTSTCADWDEERDAERLGRLLVRDSDTLDGARAPEREQTRG